MSLTPYSRQIQRKGGRIPTGPTMCQVSRWYEDVVGHMHWSFVQKRAGGKHARWISDACMQDGDLDHFIMAQGGQLLSEEAIMLKFVQICLAVHYIHSKVSLSHHTGSSPSLTLHAAPQCSNGAATSQHWGAGDRLTTIEIARGGSVSAVYNMQGLIHRDLKAGNLLLSNGIVKLGDFGISKLLATHESAAQTMVGTPYYMSPEILQVSTPSQQLILLPSSQTEVYKSLSVLILACEAG